MVPVPVNPAMEEIVPHICQQLKTYTSTQRTLLQPHKKVPPRWHYVQAFKCPVHSSLMPRLGNMVSTPNSMITSPLPYIIRSNMSSSVRHNATCNAIMVNKVICKTTEDDFCRTTSGRKGKSIF